MSRGGCSRPESIQSPYSLPISFHLFFLNPNFTLDMSSSEMDPVIIVESMISLSVIAMIYSVPPIIVKARSGYLVPHILL
eukprot:gene25807-biopygen8842